MLYSRDKILALRINHTLQVCSVGIFFVALSAFILLIPTAHAQPVQSFAKHSGGITVKMDGGALEIQVFAPGIIRVHFTLTSSPPGPPSLAVIASPTPCRWTVSQSQNEIALHTDQLVVHVKRADGTVSFSDHEGDTALAEAADGRRELLPSQIGEFDTLRSQQTFSLAPDEAIYGLGQHQQGLMNYRGSLVHLQQENREVAVPMLVSSRGYGILWDNPAITEVDVGKTSGSRLTWTSEASDSIDYYFMYGPDLDKVIAEYRQLTGAAPMFGEWAWGFWQCKNRYQSQQELLDVATHYRSLQVPIDGVIQDWQYWTPNHPWGSHEFDEQRYPDPKKMIANLHAENVHVLISVWPKFDLGSANAEELAQVGGLYPQVVPYVDPEGKGQWYDPFNPKGREVYWRQMSRKLFSLGIDGWWLDGSEAELAGKWGEFRDYQTAAGPGARVFNAYPLMHTGAVYEGQRTESPAKRVFILTRSAYAGQQRNSAVTWSGDIEATWDVFARQIPAGLNFSMSGIPYWNTDTGGFFGGDPAKPGYAELFTRWFEFSAFCPMFRVHGDGPAKEMWRFDPATQKVLIDYDQLRYHLLPYIYSVSWMVTSDGFTMMRPLVMDFRKDERVREIGDQYLFGPEIMAAPVIKAGAAARSLYLPAGTNWIDFWTGKSYDGGQTIDAAAAVATMPLFVRAGSIIPYGPSIEYAAEKNDPIELRIYRGANGEFTLYEDEGDNYNYERGAYSTIPIAWTESTRTLTIGKRRGKFPGMSKQHTFRIVWVAPQHGAGIPLTKTVDRIVKYTGNALTVRLNNSSKIASSNDGR